MNLTKRQKILIIEGAILQIDTKDIHESVTGICGAVASIYRKIVGNYSWNKIEVLLEYLDIKPPKVIFNPLAAHGGWWYPFGVEGDNKRRAHLRRVLKKLKGK